MVPIVRIVGKTGVGKTFVMERLVAELKSRGYRIATVKHSTHDIDLDREGKDSWQHAQAGSDTVVLSSPHKFALISKADHDQSLGELSRYIGLDFDIILAEGFKHDKGPKIEVHRKELGGDLMCAQEGLTAVVTSEPMELNVPRFSPEDTAGLADLIEKVFLTKDDQEIVTLFVNGEPVPLNSFVRGIFINILSAMIASLKRIPKANSIEISVRKKSLE